MNRQPGRSWRIAAIACGAIAVVGVAIGRIALVDRQPESVGANRAQADRTAVARTESPILFVTPLPGDPGSVRDFGPYRLVPFGFVGDLRVEVIPIPKGIQSADPVVVRASPLYREVSPTALPEAMQITATSTGAGDTESEIHLQYAVAGTARTIEVSWGRIGRRPIIVNLPKDGVRNFFVKLVADDLYTLTSEGYASAPDGTQGSRLTLQVRMTRGDREAWVSTTSQTYSEDDLIRIARDILR